MPLRGTIGQIIKTHKRRNNKELSIEWQIEKFFSLSDEVGDWYESPFFCFNDSCWLLKLFPNGHKRSGDVQKSSECVILYIEKKDTSPPKRVHVKFSIRGSNEFEMKVETQWEFSNGDNPWFWCQICLRSELKKLQSRLMPDNILNISCDLKVDMPNSTRASFFQDASVQTDEDRQEQNTNNTDESQALDKKDASIQTDEADESKDQSSKQGEKLPPSKRKIPDSEESSVINKKMKGNRTSPRNKKIPKCVKKSVVSKRIQGKLIKARTNKEKFKETFVKKKSANKERIPESKEAFVQKKSSKNEKISESKEAFVVMRKMRSERNISNKEKIQESKETIVIIDKTQSGRKSKEKIPEKKEAIAVNNKMQGERKSSTKKNIPKSKEASVVRIKTRSERQLSTKEKIPGTKEAKIVSKKMQSKRPVRRKIPERFVSRK